MDLMEGDEGLRDKQGLDASMHVMGYIFKRQKKLDWLCGSRGRRTAAKSRNATGAGAVKWKQSCRRSKDLERGYETSEDQDIKMQ